MEINEKVELIEELLAKPYCLIDILPFQVSADSKGAYFDVEEHYLKQDKLMKIREHFLNVVLKLYCYHALSIVKEDLYIKRPHPADLEKLFMKNVPFNILIEDRALLSIDSDDTYMTLYGADDEMLPLIKDLASSEGLFLWQH